MNDLELLLGDLEARWLVGRMGFLVDSLKGEEDGFLSLGLDFYLGCRR